MAQTTIAIPKVLLQRITEMAKRERRTRNNMIQVLLEDEIAAYEREHAPAVHIVAEQREGYTTERDMK